MGGVFVKKWTFPPQNKTKPIFCILHLLIRGVRTHPPHPPLPRGLSKLSRLTNEDGDGP